MDRMTKDMADMLTSNQDMEETNRKLELEIKDLKRTKSDLEHSNHEQSLQIQKVSDHVSLMFTKLKLTTMLRYIFYKLIYTSHNTYIYHEANNQWGPSFLYV